MEQDVHGAIVTGHNLILEKVNIVVNIFLKLSYLYNKGKDGFVCFVPSGVSFLQPSRVNSPPPGLSKIPNDKEID